MAALVLLLSHSLSLSSLFSSLSAINVGVVFFLMRYPLVPAWSVTTALQRLSFSILALSATSSSWCLFFFMLSSIMALRSACVNVGTHDNCHRNRTQQVYLFPMYLFRELLFQQQLLHPVALHGSLYLQCLFLKLIHSFCSTS